MDLNEKKALLIKKTKTVTVTVGITKSQAPADIFSISDLLKQYLALGINELNNSGFKFDGGDEDDPELSKYIKDLNTKSESISKKFIKGLGQMYKGVLIKDQVSVRSDGGVYRYRCQYSLNYDDICRSLYNQKQEVLNNMGTNKGELLFQVIDKIMPQGDRNNDVLTINTEVAKGVTPITPFNMFDFETEGYSYDEKTILPKGRILTISQIEYNRGEVSFQENDGRTLHNPIAHKICIAKHKDIITQIRNEVISELDKKKNELNQIEQLIDNNLGKYIIVAELSDGN